MPEKRGLRTRQDQFDRFVWKPGDIEFIDNPKLETKQQPEVQKENKRLKGKKKT